MISFLLWYIIITLAGWLAFPLAYRFLPKLADRGYSLTRALGWLVWGYFFWIGASFKLLQNDIGGLLIAACILAGLSFWALQNGRFTEIKGWVSEHKRYLITVELVFLAAFAVWALVRSMDSNIDGTEKPMELAFLNAILRSPSFPPHDPWLSGYAISYYYFGYVLVSILIRLSASGVGVGFNLALALLFGLTAAGAYGLVYNLLALRHKHAARPRLSLPLLGPFFVLVASNLEGVLEFIHARGITWSQSGGTWTSPFFKWLGILEIDQPPALPFSWNPNRPGGVLYWRASRVLADYSLNGGFREVIDEFPFFSYLLGDLHPHVLAMPFAMLMIGLALNVYLERGENSFEVFGFKIPFSRPAFWMAALLLGGLAFLNTWDFPIYVALVAAAYTLSRIQTSGWAWARLGDFIGLGLALGVCGAVLYLPFYVGFASQAGGPLPSLVFFTRGAQFWVMFAPLALPLLALLVYWLFKRGADRSKLVKAGIAANAIVAFLWLTSDLYAVLISKLPDLGTLFLQGVMGADPKTSIWSAISCSLVGCVRPDIGYYPGRLTAPGTWISLTVLIGLALGLIFTTHRKPNVELEQTQTELPVAAEDHPSTSLSMGFWLILVLGGAMLVLVPEFFYLRDQFGYRMNTIFKFYYQAWLLWGIGAAFACAVLIEELRGAWAWVNRAALLVLCVAALAYPLLALRDVTNNFNPGKLSLDGNAYLSVYDPDAEAAIQFLIKAPSGTLAEADGMSYHPETDRMSTHSGDPTVLGWTGHELQWRGGDAEMLGRPEDLQTLYQSTTWEQADGVLIKYGIRYVIVGPIERQKYHLNERKFQTNLSVAYQNNSYTIYQVPEFTPNISTAGQTVGEK
jgi:YYY domain-containing protein